jgi:DNA modification methylase
MITKDQLQDLKQDKLPELYSLLSSSDSRSVLFILENLGYLPQDFNANFFLPFTKNENHAIRYWAVKNIGKISNQQMITHLAEIVKSDPDSMVRREAVSSIGRMRLPQAQPILFQLLKDPDPKVVLQAIRGLLVFKAEPTVQNSLRPLLEHPNETIQNVIRHEFPTEENLKQTKPHQQITSPDFLKNTVVNADVRFALKSVPDESLHLTFTSPPYYNARDYSIYVSYQAYLDFLTEVFQQIHRCTKEGRFLVVNTSPIIIPRVSRAHSSKRYPIPFDLHTRLVQIGWEFIDDIIWKKPESSVKNRNAGFLQHRKPLGYKANAITEYLMVYRKATDKLLDWNMSQYDWQTVEQSKVLGDYETSNVWEIDPTFDRVHSAVFPIELCNRVIKFYSYKGDLVFDPFGGSGTLGKAARNLERYFFLTEQESVYVERMKADLGQPMLFSQFPTRFLQLDEFAVLGLEYLKNGKNR